MTGLRRFSIALFLCAGLLFAFSSIALPYREATTQIIPDGADDLDYVRSVGGSSPSPRGNDAVSGDASERCAYARSTGHCDLDKDTSAVYIFLMAWRAVILPWAAAL
jgi:hypothetical protein